MRDGRGARALAFTAGAGLLTATVGLLTGAPGGAPSLERVRDDSSWTRSDERIYFFQDVPYQGRAVFSIRLDGRDERRVLAPPVEDFILSGDGRKLAFSRPLREAERVHAAGRPTPGECGVLDARSTETISVAPHCWEAVWDPASRYLAYQPGNQNLFVYDTISRTRRKVGEAEGELTEASWSPDGSRIYFQDRLTQGTFEVDLLKGKQRRLAEPASRKPCLKNSRRGARHLHFGDPILAEADCSRVVSPGGSRALWTQEGSLVAGDAWGGEGHIVLRNTTGFRPELGEMGFQNPVWSSDERYALGEYRGRIIVVELHSGRAGIVTRGRRPATWVAGSPAYRFASAATPEAAGGRAIGPAACSVRAPLMFE